MIPPQPSSLRATLAHHAHLRRRFVAALWRYLHIVWPILSSLIAVQLLLGVIIGYVERWPFGASVYFTFITGLTIGYGDLVPTHAVSRLLAVLIGVIGALVAGLFAAVGVRALQDATTEHPQ
ncbi:MAG: potassium channel family protein [Acetobacteraceae bacterium]